MLNLIYMLLLTAVPAKHVHHNCECAPAPVSMKMLASENLVITEIMQNPKAVSDTNGEWFEVFNPGAATINMNGWTIRDNDLESHLIQTDVFIPAGSYAVLARNANVSQNGGVTAVYQYSNFSLGNGADEVVLVRPDSSIADQTLYDGGSAWPDPNGASMVLSTINDDNNVGSNWSTSSETIAGGSDKGTPGSGPDVGSGGSGGTDLVITEIMQNPSAVSDASGEWFEVYNPGSQDVNMNGWTIADHDLESHTITTDVIVSAGGYAVLANNSNSATNGNIAVDYQWANFTLANGADEVVLYRADSSIADEVSYDGGSAWPDPTGASMELISVSADNDLGSNWTVAVDLIPGSTDYGTPAGGAGGTPPTGGTDLMVSEIMQNPSAVADGSGEWFEVYNPGTASVNMNGWTIRDNDTDSFTITSDVLVAPGGFAVLGINGNQSTNGGIEVDYVFSGMALSNSADEIVLVRPDSSIADEVLYDGGPVWPDPTGASTELTSLSADNSVGSNWAEATLFISGSSGDKGTPGLAPDGSGGGDPPGNNAPVVDAGSNQTHYLDGLSVLANFSGSATDPDGDSLTIQWSLTAGNATAVTLNNATTLGASADITALGSYTFQLSASDAEFTSLDSVTIHVVERPAPGSYQIYLGNVHSHSGYSDGNQNGSGATDTAAYAFRYARDNGEMDWIIMADHNHTDAGMSASNFVAGVADASTVTAESSAFVALFGTEWGTISTGGHVNYVHDQLWGWQSGNDVSIAKGDYDALFNQVNAVSTFAHLCHPSQNHFDGIFNNAYNSTWDDAVGTIAIKSGPAFSTAMDFSDLRTNNDLDLYHNLLLKGYHVGPASDQDSHNANWGMANGQRTAVLTTELTQTAIVEALRLGRTYASDDRNLYVTYGADHGGNSYVLSETILANVNDTITFNVDVSDLNAESTASIRLLTGTVGGSIVSTATTGSSSVLAYNVTPTSSGTYFYYAEVTQADGHQAWTAPIWVVVN